MAIHALRHLHRSKQKILKEAFATHAPTEYQRLFIERGEQNRLLRNHFLIERKLQDSTAEKYLARHLPSGTLKIIRTVDSPHPRTEISSPDWASSDVRKELDAHVSRVPVRVWSRRKLLSTVALAMVAFATTTIGIQHFNSSSQPAKTDLTPPSTTVFSEESFTID